MATLQTKPLVIEHRPLDWFKPDPNQPRKSFDEAKLRSLGERQKVGRFPPIGD